MKSFDKVSQHWLEVIQAVFSVDFLAVDFVMVHVAMQTVYDEGRRSILV